MSALFFAIPFTLFVLFVAPVWLWLHYSHRQNGGLPNASEAERMQHLTQQAQRMAARIQALEEILDAEHPNWRQS